MVKYGSGPRERREDIDFVCVLKDFRLRATIVKGSAFDLAIWTIEEQQ